MPTFVIHFFTNCATRFCNSRCRAFWSLTQADVDGIAEQINCIIEALACPRVGEDLDFAVAEFSCKERTWKNIQMQTWWKKKVSCVAGYDLLRFKKISMEKVCRFGSSFDFLNSTLHFIFLHRERRLPTSQVSGHSLGLGHSLMFWKVTTFQFLFISRIMTKLRQTFANVNCPDVSIPRKFQSLFLF